MTRYDFEIWLNKLPLQTLTDELKADILEEVNDMLLDEINNIV